MRFSFSIVFRKTANIRTKVVEARVFLEFCNEDSSPLPVLFSAVYLSNAC